MTPKGFLFDVQPFSLHDGPGTRTTVFMQGCDLRCKWCHNPESQPINGALLFYPQKCIGCGACVSECPAGNGGKTARRTDECLLCGRCVEACYAEAVKKSGRFMDADELTAELLRDRDTYRKSGGGVTFSGGEPLLQADFVAGVMRRLKDENIHTAVETCLCVPWDSVEKVLPLTDLFYADVKCVTSERHREGTGGDNRAILDNIRRIADADANLILRTPVVPGFNDSRDELEKIGEFVRTLNGQPALELMAFHNMCAPKYAALGREFLCADTPQPGRDEMETYTAILTRMGLDVTYRM